MDSEAERKAEKNILSKRALVSQKLWEVPGQDATQPSQGNWAHDRSRPLQKPLISVNQKEKAYMTQEEKGPKGYVEE